jgi:hypothetical protein
MLIHCKNNYELKINFSCFRIRSNQVRIRKKKPYNYCWVTICYKEIN